MTFESESFDLVFGRGIIHHLDLDLAFQSIHRVLRPGGLAIFWEPLGHNPILNRYRDMTPNARTPDEHPLLKQDFKRASKYFDLEHLKFYGLTTILSVPMRDTAFGDSVLRNTAKLDQMIFKTPARWMAWHVLMEMKKAR
jgi:SAM-dependent methyltransferase